MVLQQLIMTKMIWSQGGHKAIVFPNLVLILDLNRDEYQPINRVRDAYKILI